MLQIYKSVYNGQVLHFTQPLWKMHNIWGYIFKQMCVINYLGLGI